MPIRRIAWILAGHPQLSLWPVEVYPRESMINFIIIRRLKWMRESCLSCLIASNDCEAMIF